MKILAVGNSFSMNTTEHFNTITNLLSIDANVINLYVPGCSLETHINNFKSDALYELQVDALKQNSITLKEALMNDRYDVITLQQASDYSGMISSLEPSLGELIEIVKTYQSDAEIYYHQTWSYDQDSNHPAFINYELDYEIMYQAILEVSHYVNNIYKLPIIQTGTVLQLWRNLSEISAITKDGYHLQDGAPKILAACIWIHTIAQKLNKEDIEIVSKHFNLSSHFIYTFEKILKSLE